MAVKAAKDKFTKQEIIEILKQNVALYKNEPEFVEYIVNLSLYLIDQAYTVTGERSGDLESVLEQLGKARDVIQAALPDVTAPAEDSDPDELDSRDAFLPDEDELDQETPTTNKMKLQLYDAVLKSPPPPEPPDDLDPPTQQLASVSREAERIEEIGEDDVIPTAESPDMEELEDLSFEDDEPRTRQLRSVGILTPEPEGELSGKGEVKKREPKPAGDVDKGKARVYKVARSYSAARSGDSNCPICGTDTRGASRCPSCGHIM